MLKLKDETKFYWNAVRGLCIISVIFFHVTIPHYTNGIIRWEWYVFRRITAFAVAVFFFMAGYFVHFDNINDKKYLWAKIKRVLIPYLIFSTIYIVINFLLGSEANWKGIVANYLLGTAEVHMYFCIYLIQMILLLPLLKKCIDSKYRNSIISMIFVLSIICGYIKTIGIDTTMSNWVCLSFLIYYVLGLYVKGYVKGSYESVLLSYIKRKNVGLLIIYVLCSLFVALVDGVSTYPDIQIGQVSMGNYVYCIAVLGLFLNIFWNYKGGLPINLRPLVWLGEYSFHIYLCHMIIMRPMIVWSENSNLPYPWQQIILFFGTLGGCVLIIAVKNIICTKYLVGGKRK